MHYKNIKLIVKKQLKREFPKWKHLPKKMKREIFSKVMDEVQGLHDGSAICLPLSPLYKNLRQKSWKL